MQLHRLRNDVRKKYYFAGQIQTSSAGPCPNKLLVKKGWTANPQSDTLEDKLNLFITNLESIHKNHLINSKPSSNLTTLQKSHVNILRKNEHFVILMCDKNLGSAILERKEYIRLALHEHLHDRKNYTILTEDKALSQLENLRTKAMKLFVNNTNNLTDHDINYFRHFLLQIPTKCRIPQFYGMPKVHKNKTPVPLRPVIAQCGSFTAFISTWLDIKLQAFKHHLPSYIKNST